jgi:hypothetical protein
MAIAEYTATARLRGRPSGKVTAISDSEIPLSEDLLLARAEVVAERFFLRQQPGPLAPEQPQVSDGAEQHLFVYASGGVLADEHRRDHCVRFLEVRGGPERFPVLVEHSLGVVRGEVVVVCEGQAEGAGQLRGESRSGAEQPDLRSVTEAGNGEQLRHRVLRRQAAVKQAEEVQQVLEVGRRVGPWSRVVIAATGKPPEERPTPRSIRSP